MIEKTLTIPDLGFIAGTRVALGIGIGLLLSGTLSKEQREMLGWALLAGGILTTIPILISVLSEQENRQGPVIIAA
jgi:multisubunit Na+/H+ antiporter MnhB subunit